MGPSRLECEELWPTLWPYERRDSLRCLTPAVCPVRGGAVLEAGEKYSFNDDGSELTIMEVTKLDEGDYTCIARNKAGESDQELSLTVFGEERSALCRAVGRE